MVMPNKPCKSCGGAGHTAMRCFQNKRSPIHNNKKYMRRIGKQGQKWLVTRSQWFKENPGDFYYCYIDGERLTPKETTLDHIQSRSRHPELRHEMSNLAPCCYKHNKDKGSLSLEEYREKIKA